MTHNTVIVLRFKARSDKYVARALYRVFRQMSNVKFKSKKYTQNFPNLTRQSTSEKGCNKQTIGVVFTSEMSRSRDIYWDITRTISIKKKACLRYVIFLRRCSYISKNHMLDSTGWVSFNDYFDEISILVYSICC